MTKQNEKDAKRVPELRFKGFTDDWEQRKLGEIGSFRSGVGFPESEQGGTAGIPFYKVSDMNLSENNTVMNISSNYVTDDQISRNKWKPIDGNTIIFAKVGAAVFLERKRQTRCKFLIDNNMMSYKPNSIQDHDYIYYTFQNLNLSHYAQIGSLPSLNAGELKNVNIVLPDQNERSKVSQLFLNLDRTITLHEEQHRQLERLKKALLQKMFADETGYPALRFKGFTEKWEQSYLKDIASVNSGRDYKHLNKGNIPVYGTGGYMLSVDKALSNTKDGIGIGRKGTINNPYILKAPFWTVDTLFYVIPYNVDLNFLYGIFQKIDWRKKDESTGVPSLSKENINKTKFKIPAISEQKEIGTIFQNLDTLITLHQHKIDNLKRLKRALLQKMFV
ncbi:restriction endonuclease subunit S [Limosilactobacillus mucosae]|uniref:restriction endonuclease subunit S n=1 Tax=Limosilactobacillus mucosae TaxID=97478 RepID=UPI003C6D713A